MVGEEEKLCLYLLRWQELNNHSVTYLIRTGSFFNFFIVVPTAPYNAKFS
jgi:hypothetical protein